MSKFRLENLDSIRSIAFLSTFFAHAFFAETSQIQNNPIYINAIKFQELLSFGVPIFFVLSGFLITLLIIKEQDETNSFSIKNFYIRRILRGLL